MLSEQQVMQEQQFQQQLQSKIKEYYIQRSADDIDLVGEVVNILTHSGLGHRVQEFLSDPLIMESMNKASHVQRFNLNRYFTKQLLRVEARSTLDERYCLIPNGQIEAWLKLFSSKVIPTLVEYDLPRTY